MQTVRQQFILQIVTKSKDAVPIDNTPKRTEFKQQVFRAESNLSKVQQVNKKIGKS